MCHMKYKKRIWVWSFCKEKTVLPVWLTPHKKTKNYNNITKQCYRNEV